MSDNFKVIGTGSFVPKKIVTNDDLAKMMDTSDEWISKRVGVKQRHICIDETVSEMAVTAAKRALEMSKTEALDIDLIVCASVSAEYSTPNLACIVQKEIGANGIAFDVNSACSGFLFALEAAAGYFARGKAKKAIVIGAERLSGIVDWDDRSTAVIFGDGAGAVVLESGDNYVASKLSSHGRIDVLNIPNDYASYNPFRGAYVQAEHFIHMDGQETFKFAVPAMCNDIKEAVSMAGIKLEDVRHVIPHQANIRIIELAAKKLKIDREYFHTNIDRTGNTSSASVPILLDEVNRSGVIKENEYVVLAAFGGGLSSAACVIRW